MNGWTAERRAKASAAIHRWKPWEKATGPKTTDGKARSRMNGFKGNPRETRRREMRAIREALDAHNEAIWSIFDRLSGENTAQSQPP
jgi:hypothetical protein